MCIYAPCVFFFTAAQRACTALRAASLRSSWVMRDARTLPPTLPPLRPRATAAGFFLLEVFFLVVMT